MRGIVAPETKLEGGDKVAGENGMSNALAANEHQMQWVTVMKTEG